MKNSMLESVRSARGAAVPLVAVNTPDPAHTIKGICEVTTGDRVCQKQQSPVTHVIWDLIQGFSSRDQLGEDAVVGLGTDTSRGNPPEAMILAKKLPRNTVLFVHMASRWIEQPAFIQSVWNLRDEFKATSRMVVLLGPHFTLPPELSNDILLLDEPLPTVEELEGILASTAASADMVLTSDVMQRSINAVQGIPAFPAEQSAAMSMRLSGMRVDDLWERKRKLIEQTPALSVWREGDNFSKIRGYDNVKGFLSRFIRGKRAPQAIVFIDEIEKALAGEGDTSGVSQDQLNCLLSYMEDHQSHGCLFIGGAGTGKSAVAKATGNEAGVPTIQLDLGGAKGSLVGQSEQQIRSALKTITAVSSDKTLWLATCNSIANLPTSLRRRFRQGTFYFDLPTAEERELIWVTHLAGYDLPSKEIMSKPNDDGWTGAEIRNCCELADSLGVSIKQAAKYITPISKADPQGIDRLRSECSGRYLSASYEGLYQKDRRVEENGRQPRGRQVSLAD